MPLLLDPDAIARLRADLRAAPYTAARCDEVLEAVAAGALAREQRLPAERATRAHADPVAVLIRLFILGDPVDLRDADRALPSLGSAGAIALGLARIAGDALIATSDLQPYGDENTDWWVASDQGEIATRAPLRTDHVLGVGGASATLAAWTPRPRVSRALDLGTGCGVQALHLAGHADRIVATDLSTRALAYAAFNAALNEQEWELRTGSMLEPVAGERFGLIVSNPPFVITPRDAHVPTYEYRDAGGHGDDTVQALVAGLGEHLEPGGIAQILANWEVSDGGDWRNRIGAWAQCAGVDAWVVLREIQDPGQYAETWARDGGQQSGTADYARMYASWLDDFASRSVTGVAFGVVTLHRPTVERVPFVELTDARGPVTGPMGPVIERGIAARSWLAEHDDDAVLDATWTVAQDVTVEHHYRPGEAEPRVIVARQGGGLRVTDRLDTVGAALLSVCDGDLSARAALVAIAALLDLDADEVRAEQTPRLRGWIADGLIVAATG